MRFVPACIRKMGFSCTTALTLCLVASLGVAQGSTTLPLQEGAAAERPRIEVLSSNPEGVHLTFELPAMELESYDLDGDVFQTVAIAGGQLYGEVGEPSLPGFTRYVAIPARSGTQLRILSVEEETLSGYRLLPMQDPEGETFVLNADAYRSEEFLGGETVRVGAPVVMRDLRVVPLHFHPVRYSPARGEIRVARRVEVKLAFTGVDLRNTKERERIPPSPAFDRLYRSAVVNYGLEGDERSGTLAPNLGTWLIISRDNSSVITLLQPLIEWRQKMGYNVVHVTTTVTGTNPSSIQSWIQEAYEDWEFPPEQIVIVGDVSGSFPIGTFDEPWYGGMGDHPYSQLAGDDLMPDAFVGRLSAENYSTLETIVNKIVSYESTPHTEHPAWFTRACLVGDPTYSGLTCIQIQQWVKEKLIDLGYADAGIDTIWSSPFVSQMSNSVNQGCSYFGYRGYWGMSGWDTGDIYALSNTGMLPFAVSLTCGTGTFYSGTSIHEAWLRAGSADEPRGGIGGVATATLGTHTRYNNCFYGGIAYGLFWEGHYQIGAAHARGKVEMILNYEDYQYTQAVRYCYWNTLMGDPATEIWTGYPNPLSVGYSPTVAVGANAVTVMVQDDENQPLEGVWVYMIQDGESVGGGYTNEGGRIDLPIDTSTPGTVQLTATAHNFYPHQGSFNIAQQDYFVGIGSHEIDDDAIPQSQGNGDGQINPGEIIELNVSLKNFGTQDIEDITLTISCEDLYVGEWIEGGPISYGDIPSGVTVDAPIPLVFRVYEGCPNGHEIHIDLRAEAGLYSWHSMLDLPVSAPDLLYHSCELGGLGSRLDPGESGTIAITIENIGPNAAGGPIQAILISESYSVHVTDPYGTYPGTIGPGATGANSADPFGVSAPWDCVPGQLASLRLALQCADGTRDTVFLALEVGGADSQDPTGPDAYGYYAYDHTDTSYPEAPVYSWIEINPSYGGPGTTVGLGDFGWNQDDSETVDLPFDFTFYGTTFSRATICSNGWMSMGSTYLTNYRNWYMPSAGGPAFMIAPFWDNLYQSGSGKVYHWVDPLNHRYVIAWDNVKNRNTGSTESFEIILYDPAWHPTQTGDGVIVFQFETVNNNDSEQMYCTVGIQDEEHTTGITFNYFQQKPSTAANLTAGLAIKFTTDAPGAQDLHIEKTLDPLHLLLGQNEPNPWSNGTAISFQLERLQPVALRVFDVDGHLVRTLARGALPGGDHTIDWRGLDDRGLPVPSGIYFYRLDAAERSVVRKMLVVR